MSKYQTQIELSLKVSFHVEDGEISQITLANQPKNCLEWEILGDTTENKELNSQITLWFEAYAKKRSAFPKLPFKHDPVTPFGSLVYSKMAKIPFGSSLSYKELAMQAGKPNAARAVGNLCGRNPFPLVIPCHRVLKTGGGLGGFSGGLDIKEKLLAFEKSR